ncbi:MULTISPECIES: hypothetical protein [Nitrosomonas]|uniref:hypothetical protein n=1 Tax=Nitrosomonas TaxID=914 RepID=UPI0011874008|nr:MULTISPECIES: hypothetical protein [Nitrosomonas]UVS62159.1 hypothetical protein NX761_03230 [Nitrosomonas sp. PLL12]
MTYRTILKLLLYARIVSSLKDKEADASYGAWGMNTTLLCVTGAHPVPIVPRCASLCPTSHLHHPTLRPVPLRLLAS